jgi:DNA-binding beta-propeller fold protein YncE
MGTTGTAESGTGQAYALTGPPRSRLLAGSCTRTIALRIAGVMAVLAAGAALATLAALSAGATSGPLRAHSHRSAARGLTSLPLAAQAPVSAALGAAEPRYALHDDRGLLVAVNPAQGLRASFDRSGAHVRADAARLGLTLSGVGEGGTLRPLAGVIPRARANRVFYDYAGAGLTESFVNGPLGLEQRFTVARALAGDGGPLTLSLSLSGNVRGRVGAGRRSVLLKRPGAPALSYSGLVVTDARGRSLHAWLAIRRRQLLVRVDARGARYPVSIDPLIQQGSELTGLGVNGSGFFGASVALSSNGGTALVGAPHDTGNNGAAFVFVRSGSTWSQQAELVSDCTGGSCTNEGTGESGHGNFGTGVALSADGSTAAIGAPFDNSSEGAVWVFTRSGSSWTQQTELVADCTSSCDNEGIGETAVGSFGNAVALSADGGTLLAGAPLDNSDGAAWVFTRSGSSWTQQAQLVGDCTSSCANEGTGESAGGEFGQAVALSGLGTTALIGAPTSSDGAAWTFTYSGSSWTAEPKLVGDCTSNCTGQGTGESGQGMFGSSVALSSDANTALIGADYDNTGVGAAWVFTNFQTAWTEQTKLVGDCTSSCTHEATDESGDGWFGTSASLSSNGNLAVIGAYQDADADGAAFAFTRSQNVWTEDGAKLIGDCESDCTYEGTGGTGNGELGVGVAVSSDAGTVIVGGPADAGSVGGAWVFTPLTPEAPAISQGQQFPEVDVGASATDTATLTGDAAHGGAPSGSVTFYVCGPLAEANGCNAQGTLLGNAAVTGASDTAAISTSPAFTPRSAGTYCFYAAYGGDGADYSTSADGGRDGCLRVSTPSTSAPAYAYSSDLGGAGSPGAMNGPQGVALGPPETLYVADTGDNQIEEFGVANGLGAYSAQISGPGYEDGQVDAPLGLAYDSTHQNLYAVDSDPETGDPRVEVFDSTNTFKSTIGSGGSVGCTTFDSPLDVATDPATSAVYVTDQGASPAVHEFTGSSCRTIGDAQLGPTGQGDTRAGTPAGVAVDPVSGDVYVADQQNDRIVVFGPGGGFKFQFASPGSGNGQLNDPAGIAIDRSTGNVYVADSATTGSRSSVLLAPISRSSAAPDLGPVS